ncbi:teleost multiple tissue opsin 3b [Pygocentrus nattereri]|uniref:teleost multiple tissue opsin 3b n=1 Tax=Pygocentrus nattereri TaxID=42514 RepID=UPI0018910CAA|nr:teleost multiple tissue opsin 3b [Pygocentrus nattereri]
MLFTRFHFLRTPINLLLLNISVSDMLVCLFGTPFSFAASICGRWLTGAHGCRWYGFANTLFGVVSLVSLALLSYERCCSVLCGSKMDVLDHRKVRLSIAGCWVYSLIWTVPPLFGWSGYGPEGPGTTCSVRWALRTPGSRAYIICLFIFCLVLPLLTIIFCYGRILITVHGAAKVQRTAAQRREGWVLLMVLIMVSCYLFCWLPYGVVALLGTFGPSGSVSPTASIVPSVLAKSSTVLNPIIYAFFNKQFYRCFLVLVKCESGSPSLHTLHTLHTQPSSYTDDSAPNGIALGLYRDPSPSDSPKHPHNSGTTTSAQCHFLAQPRV